MKNITNFLRGGIVARHNTNGVFVFLNCRYQLLDGTYGIYWLVLSLMLLFGGSGCRDGESQIHPTQATISEPDPIISGEPDGEGYHPIKIRPVVVHSSTGDLVPDVEIHFVNDSNYAFGITNGLDTLEVEVDDEGDYNYVAIWGLDTVINRVVEISLPMDCLLDSIP